MAEVVLASAIIAIIPDHIIKRVELISHHHTIGDLTEYS